jgi:hypothetical protein
MFIYFVLQASVDTSASQLFSLSNIHPRCLHHHHHQQQQQQKQQLLLQQLRMEFK